MSTPPKDRNESYIHYYAKEVLLQWLRSANGRFYSMRWNPFGQRIYTEYPILLVDGKPTHGPENECYDEIPSKCCSCPILYENLLLTSAINPCSHRFVRLDNIPSRDEVIASGFKLGAVVDVVVIEGGRLKYLFEVVHTNPCSPMKRKLLLRYATAFNAVVYEVDSDYILRQICKPDRWRGTKMEIDERKVRRWRPRRRRK